MYFDRYDWSAALWYSILDVVLEHLAGVFKALGPNSLHWQVAGKEKKSLELHISHGRKWEVMKNSIKSQETW